MIYYIYTYTHMYSETIYKRYAHICLIYIYMTCIYMICIYMICIYIHMVDVCMHIEGIYITIVAYVWQVLTYVPKLVFSAVHKRLLPLYDAQKHSSTNQVVWYCQLPPAPAVSPLAATYLRPFLGAATLTVQLKVCPWGRVEHTPPVQIWM